MTKDEDLVSKSLLPVKSWKNLSFDHLNTIHSIDESFRTFALRSMSEIAKINEGTRIDAMSIEGKVEDFSEFKKVIDDLGGRFIVNDFTISPEQKSYDTFDFCVMWDHAFLVGSITEKNWLVINFYSMDSNLFIELTETLRSLLKKRTSQSDFYMLTKDSDGLFSLSNINVKAAPLIRENYEQNVIANIEHVLQELKNDEPCGRITIIEGPPGTGKTHLVRGLVRETKDCTVVLFTPTIMSEFSAPGILTAFLCFRKQSEGPMVLVLEDGDQCLAPRGLDNITSINEILGLSDGILGEALDIRIIVTTNMKKTEIDEAILRPGRLCRHILVNKLSRETEKKVMERLGVSGEAAGRSLAQIYELSKGGATKVMKNNSIGFGS